jgi:RNA polymerase sigma factor (sigma-70 family)
MSSYNGSTTFVTWLFTIARNEAFSYMRKSDKNISIDDDEFILTSNKININETADLEEYKESLNISVIDVLDEIVSEDTNEEIDVLEIKENEIKKKLNQVLEKINSLPIIYSTLLIDRFVNNLPYVDIALKNNLNINTVRTRLKKAKTLLSAIL